MSPKDHRGQGGTDADDDWGFPFEAELHAFAPALDDAQSAGLSHIDSLTTPDRKTHELIRMVCMVIRRNTAGVSLHSMLAAEVGATWEEVAGSITLTEPSFGLLNAAEALPAARAGWEKGRRKAPGSKKPASKANHPKKQ